MCSHTEKSPATVSASSQLTAHRIRGRLGGPMGYSKYCRTRTEAGMDVPKM